MTNILCCAGELAEVRQLGGGCERGGARVQLRLQAARVQSDQVHEENENTCLVLQFQITVSHFSVCCRYQNICYVNIVCGAALAASFTFILDLKRAESGRSDFRLNLENKIVFHVLQHFFE